MRKLSNLLLLTISLCVSAPALAVHVAEDGSVSPAWVSTFGQIAENEMSLYRFSAFMREIKEKHIDKTENELVAKIWQYNGVLPMIGDGYYVLSKEATKALQSPCLYALLDDTFCVADYKLVRRRYNDESLGKKERKAPLLTTHAALKSLDAKSIDDLLLEIEAAQKKIASKTLAADFPPLQYQYLGMLKGYLEGLDAHSSTDRTDELAKKLESILLVTKADRIITIKFNAFSEEKIADQNLYYRITEALDKKYVDGDRIILDLRGNGGGYLSMALKITQLFLPEAYSTDKSRALLTAVDKLSEGFGYRSVDQNINFVPAKIYSKAPLVVLVDQESASATEILTSILQHEGRAMVIGNRTYGKGTIQSLKMIVSTKVMMRITTGFYYTVGGLTPQNHGITPDLNFPLTSKEALESLFESDQPLALPSPDLDKLSLVHSDKINLPNSVTSCAQRISTARGVAPLRDLEEAAQIAQSVLTTCYDNLDATTLGLAR